MKIRILPGIMFFISCVVTTAFSQTTCPPNLDLESGNFTNWECFIGTTDTIGGKNRMLLSPSAPVPNRHEIISAASNPGMDPYGGFPKICPYGGNYSVKLGNNSTNNEAESISYTFVVPTTIDTFTFTYFYAVVFEDPQHTPPEQPRFFVTAYDVQTGDVINCASYDYVSTAALPGFQQSAVNSAVLYKSWTPTSLQFAGLGGRNVRLEFRTADCTRSGHFGYAYFDVASACSNILATAPYCIETNSLILDAPFGFQTYTWYNSDFSAVIGSGQSYTISPPPATSGVFYVDVVPYPGFGCRDTLQAFVTPLPVPDTPDAVTSITYCQNQRSAALTAKVLPGHQLLWYTSATGGSPMTTDPVPPTAAPGIFKYYVSQKAIFGCEGFRREITVRVLPTPVVAFSINNARQCHAGNSFHFTSKSTNLEEPHYTWEFGDGKTYSSADSFSVYSYPAPGDFLVKLRTVNGKTCPAELIQKVTVIPKPVASFSFPAVLCENQMPVPVTDGSYVDGGVATINNWWWDLNGKKAQGQTPPPLTANGGPAPVKLVATTTEGCRSDTNTVTLRIGFAPRPAFSIGDLLCINEPIRFTDQSSFPPDAVGERIVKWRWTFDQSAVASAQHPTARFSGGMHNAQLVTETGLGCKSSMLEQQFVIQPKPDIQLSISDSCVFEPVTYLATDRAGDVVQWDWNFGSGYKSGPASITRTYSTEGSRPFILMAYTDKGCKDTIHRAFRIFDNKSFAGNDTIVAVGEPMQLNARGAPNMLYRWSPATGLDRPDIEKPVALYHSDQLYQLYTVTEQGCRKQSQILVKRYNGPDIYVPTAFTPNRDGLNDQFKVLPVGIRSFDFVAVYDRWGKLIFQTTNYHVGWDGTFRGALLSTGTFVYVVQAVDYKGKRMFRKGTFTLLR
jgi:gliding motility-associated-like protein